MRGRNPNSKHCTGWFILWFSRTLQREHVSNSSVRDTNPWCFKTYAPEYAYECVFVGTCFHCFIALSNDRTSRYMLSCELEYPIPHLCVAINKINVPIKLPWTMLSSHVCQWEKSTFVKDFDKPTSLCNFCVGLAREKPLSNGLKRFPLMNVTPCKYGLKAGLSRKLRKSSFNNPVVKKVRQKKKEKKVEWPNSFILSRKGFPIFNSVLFSWEISISLWQHNNHTFLDSFQ